MIIEDENKRKEYIGAIVNIYVLLIEEKFYNRITEEQFETLKNLLEQLNQIYLGRKIFNGI